MIKSWGRAGMRCKIRPGWDEAGKEGDIICCVQSDRMGQQWAVVQWDDEDDPDLFKASGLVVKHPEEKQWRRADGD